MEACNTIRAGNLEETKEVLGCDEAPVEVCLSELQKAKSDQALWWALKVARNSNETLVLLEHSFQGEKLESLAVDPRERPLV